MLTEHHYAHYDKPLIAQVYEHTESSTFDIIIYRITTAHSQREMPLDSLKEIDISRIPPDKAKTKTQLVQSVFHMKGISQQSIEQYLSEYHFLDSDLIDHHDPDMPFKLDLGTGD